MKRVMIKINVSVLLLVLASCSTNYRMTTCVYKDGRISRGVYAKADSAFLAGNRSGNPFLFQLGDRWMVENLDSCVKVDFFGEEGELNVKVDIEGGRYVFILFRQREVDEAFGRTARKTGKTLPLVLYLLYVYM